MSDSNTFLQSVFPYVDEIHVSSGPAEPREHTQTPAHPPPNLQNMTFRKLFTYVGANTITQMWWSGKPLGIV